MDIFTRAWITKNAQDVISQYSEGITLRQLHYRLVSIGMTNDTRHYKRVIGAMTEARWDGVVDMDSFVMARRLAREEGLLVGSSSGSAVHAAFTFRFSKSDLAIIILPDSGRNYLGTLHNDVWMSQNGFI